MNRTDRYNRKWLRLIRVLYPLVSLICFLFPFLPGYVLRRSLSRVQGIAVSVGRIRVTPFAFKIKVEDLMLKEQVDIADPKVYLSAETVEIDIVSAKLWRGEVCGSVSIQDMSVSVYKEMLSGIELKPGNPLLGLDIGMDITLQRLDVLNAKVQYTDVTAVPALSVMVDQIYLSAKDISTVPERQSNADINIKAQVYEGVFQAAMTVDLLSRTPDFVLDTHLSGVNMVLLNDFFQRYGRFDVSSGTMTMTSEIKAMAGKFGGYVESVIDDLHILGPEDKKDNILRYLWEGLVGFMLDVLKDHHTDELKTRINFEKPFKDPEVQVGKAVGEVLANAFLHGLTPYLRNEVKVNL